MKSEDLILGLLDRLVGTSDNVEKNNEAVDFDNAIIGKKVIVRCYSAGNWFGEIEANSKDEIYLKNARRLHGWHAKEGISLSGVAMHGVDYTRNCRIEMPVPVVWLQAIELIPASKKAIESIENCPNVEKS